MLLFLARGDLLAENSDLGKVRKKGRKRIFNKLIVYLRKSL